MAGELLNDNSIQDITEERKKWLIEFYGQEPEHEFNFNPSNVPSTNTFQKKVNEDFNKQLRKGIFSIDKVMRKDIPLTNQRLKPVESTKKRVDTSANTYNWIPYIEITTAKLRIDSFTKLPASERRELYKKFAKQVVCLIAQLDSIGQVSDQKITFEQSSALKRAFSDALLEIQKNLFKPIARQLELEERGTLIANSENPTERHIRPARAKSLIQLSEEIRNSSGKREAAGPDLGAFTANLVEVEALPINYRPVPNASLPKFDRRSFSQMAEAARAEFLKPPPHDKSPDTPKTPPPKPRKIEILKTERKAPPKPPVPPKPKPKIKRKPSKKQRKESYKVNPIPHGQFIAPESRFFVDHQKPLDTETNRPPPDVSNLMAMFTTRPPDEVFEITQPKPDVGVPEIEHTKPKTEDGTYIFKPRQDQIEEILDTDGLFTVEDDKPGREEHDNLVKLWDELDLHPDSRLLMAGKLCQVIVDDSSGDFHFQSVMQATTLLVEYTKQYKEIKMTLKYDPGLKKPEKREALDQLIRDYIVAEGSLIQANKELTHILGAEVQTSKKGTITDIINSHMKKLNIIAKEAGIDIGAIAKSAQKKK